MNEPPVWVRRAMQALLIGAVVAILALWLIGDGARGCIRKGSPFKGTPGRECLR